MNIGVPRRAPVNNNLYVCCLLPEHSGSSNVGAIVASALRLPDGVLELGFAWLEPASHGHLLLGVEVDALTSLYVEVAEERAIPAGKWEPGHWCRHPDVYTDHAGVEAVFELTGGAPAAREDDRAVSIGAVLSNID